MADELAQFGSPGVDAQGKITPFFPNPPWTTVVNSGTINDLRTGPRWDSNAILDGGTGVAVPFTARYYKDTFGVVHMKGAAYATGGTAANAFNAVAFIPTNLRPVSPMIFSGTLIQNTLFTVYPNCGLIDVTLTLGGVGNGNLYIMSPVAINTYNTIILDIEWPTT